MKSAAEAHRGAGALRRDRLGPLDPRPEADRRAGFTLAELLIALVLGLMVVAGALGVLDRQRQAARTGAIRVEVQQNARYALDMVMRDLQQAGQGMDPSHDFGVVAMLDGQAGAPDSLFILYTDPETPVHSVKDPGTGNEKTVLRLAITCGDQVEGLAAGHFVYLAHGTARGVARVTSVDRQETGSCPDGPGATGEVVAGIATVDDERHGWVLQGNVAGAAATRARALVYFVEPTGGGGGTRLVRAFRKEGGAWKGAPIAEGVVDFQAELVFRDGSIGVEAGTGGQGYDDIDTVRLRLEVEGLRQDKDLAGGDAYRRVYALAVSPRNQLYTRNLQ